MRNWIECGGLMVTIPFFAWVFWTANGGWYGFVESAKIWGQVGGLAVLFMFALIGLCVGIPRMLGK